MLQKVLPFFLLKQMGEKKDAIGAEIFSRSSYHPQKAKEAITALSRGTAQKEAGAIGYQNHLTYLTQSTLARAVYPT